MVSFDVVSEVSTPYSDHFYCYEIFQINCLKILCINRIRNCWNFCDFMQEFIYKDLHGNITLSARYQTEKTITNRRIGVLESGDSRHHWSPIERGSSWNPSSITALLYCGVWGGFPNGPLLCREAWASRIADISFFSSLG